MQEVSQMGNRFMDVRVKYAAGGLSVVSVSFALLFLVATTTTATLTDAAGTSVDLEPVVIDGASPAVAPRDEDRVHPTVDTDPAGVRDGADSAAPRTAGESTRSESAVAPVAPLALATAAAVASGEASSAKDAPMKSVWRGQPNAKSESPAAARSAEADGGVEKKSRDHRASTVVSGSHEASSRTTASQTSQASKQSASSPPRDSARSSRSSLVASQARSHDSPDRRDR